MSGEPSRRQVLLMGGTTLAAGLAGCSLPGGQETDTPVRTTPKPDGPATITTTEVETDAMPKTAGDPVRTTEQCRSGPLEPTVSEGGALIYHQRHETGRALLEQSTTIFNGTYDLSVTPEMIPNAAFIAKLQSAIPSADGPELFQWVHTQGGSFLENGLVVDQSDHLRVDPCQYTDLAWNAAQYQGQTVGLPLSAETVALYYNENIVDDPPETFEEMQTTMKRHHDPDSGQYGLEMIVHPYPVSGFAQAYGGEIYDGEADELGLTSDAVERGLRVFFEEVAPFLRAGNRGSGDTSQFDSGNAAFAIDGPWRLEALEDSDVPYGLTTLPALPDGGAPRPYTGVTLLYFSKRVAESPNEGSVARQFAEWYTTNEPRLRRLANNARYAPVHATLAGDSTLPEPIRVFSEQCKQGYPLPQNPKMNDVWDPFGDAVTEAFTSDDADLSNLLSAAEAEIRQSWAERDS